MADAGNAIRYRLSFPEPWTHLVTVEMDVPVAPSAEAVELWMPVWTPGSYLVREFSRHVQDFEPRDERGNTLGWTKIRKNRWRVDPAGAKRVAVRYRVYGREMSVRTNWIDGEFALLNGAATFLTVAGLEHGPHRVEIEVPRGWAGAWTALDRAEGGIETEASEAAGGLRRFAFTAADHDELVDSPILGGTPAIYDFAVDGVSITLANLGEGGLWDGAKAARDLEAVVREAARLYGGLPFDRYLFQNVIAEGRGGLEHKKSCVTIASRFAFRRPKAYREWLGLMSHEFFHAWNVKRSRPAPLGPFDYENEAYTRGLWVAEGITTYYTDLVLRRAGLVTDAEYLEALSDLVGKVQTTPGRLHQSLEEASFDAWIKHYRPDENSANTAISYYLKGAVAAWLLDAEIRIVTRGARSLDDLMRLLFSRHSGERGFADGDVQAGAEEIAGRSLEPFFTHVVRGREEMDYAPPLGEFGLRFRPAQEGLPGDAPPVGLGIETKASEGRLWVTATLEGGPGRDAGLDAEDEILAVGGFRVTPATFTERLHQVAPGERVEILVSRRDAIRIVPVTFAEYPGSPWRLEPDPAASPNAAEERARWLGGSKATAEGR